MGDKNKTVMTWQKKDEFQSSYLQTYGYLQIIYKKTSYLQTYSMINGT